MNKQSLFPLIFSTLLLTSCGGNDQNNQIDTQLRQQLNTITGNYQQEYAIPGVLAGIWIPGKEELIINQGVSSLEQQTPIQVGDYTRIASITKSFTTTVILQLAQEKRLDLQKPLSFYLPELNIQNKDATVVTLVNMRSGIYNYTEDQEFALEFVENPLEKVTDQHLVDVADRNKVYFAPNADWHYSNTNTVILGMLIEKITGHSAGEEITDRIINKLGMSHTVYPTQPALPTPYLNGYAFEPLENFTYTDPSYSSASGAIVSTLHDLKKWGKALGTGRPLLTQEMHAIRLNSLTPINPTTCRDDQPRPPTNCPEYDKYGLGIGEINGWIGHTGDYLGYTSLVMYNPKNQATIVILTNRSGLGIHIPTKLFKEFTAVLPE
jgi:D-alanyl-D-alanine carboxypeptidase